MTASNDFPSENFPIYSILCGFSSHSLDISLDPDSFVCLLNLYRTSSLMDSTTWVDTSLDLNLNPFSHTSEVPKKDILERNYASLEEKISVKQGTSFLAEELNRVKSENKKLTEMLSVLCENYNSLLKKYMDLTNKSTEYELGIASISKKRKAESDEYSNMIGFNGHTECSSSDEDQSCKRPKENLKAKASRIYVRTSASISTLIVKDGYQWRKYGQKVTKDNPSPRAYFKCSFAPSCPVKKKVQRSAEDPSVLVATYEGEHNHPQPSKSELLLSPSSSATVDSIPATISASMRWMAPIVTLDMTQPGGILFGEAKKSVQAETHRAPGTQQILVQQMASSLTKDPIFTAALAAAISGKFVDQARTEKWSN